MVSQCTYHQWVYIVATYVEQVWKALTEASMFSPAAGWAVCKRVRETSPATSRGRGCSGLQQTMCRAGALPLNRVLLSPLYERRHAPAHGSNTGTICSGNGHYSAYRHTGGSHLCQAISQALRIEGSRHFSAGTITGDHG